MIKRGSSSLKYRGLGAFARRKSYVKRHCASSKSKQLESSKSQTPHLTEALYSTGSHPAPPTALPALCVLQYSRDTRPCKTLFSVTQHDPHCLTSICMNINIDFLYLTFLLVLTFLSLQGGD